MKTFIVHILLGLLCATLMAGCGLFGCAGQGGNGGFIAGCRAGARF